MTRELLFNTSFEPQLMAFTGWKSLANAQGGASAALAPSDYPGFEIIPGEAKYFSFDSLGFPMGGTQSFTLRIVFSHSQLATAIMRSTHSADVSLVESFFRGGYLPPPVAPGDVARIDSMRIVTIDPAQLNKNATRSTITVHGEYYFTLF